MILAGFPATTQKGGTVRVTTALVATTLFLPTTRSPDVQTMAAPKPIQQFRSMCTVPPAVIPCFTIGKSILENSWL